MPPLRGDGGQEPGQGAVLAGVKRGEHGDDADEDAGEQDRHFRDRLPGESVCFAVLVRGEHEREDDDQHEGGVARDVLQLDRCAVHLETDAGLPGRRGENGGDDARNQQQVDAAADAELRRRLAFADGRDQPVLAIMPEVEHEESRQHQSGDERGLRPQVPRRPEEVDAVQEADEQRRVPERGERAADIGDQEDEEHDHMDIVESSRVGADERANRIMAAPVVPTTLAISVPKARIAVLTIGVPRRLPVTRMPPATT